MNRYFSRKYVQMANMHEETPNIISRQGDANQKHHETSAHTPWAGCNKKQVTSANEEVEKLERS